MTRARSVFITYVCVITETFQYQQQKNGQWQNVRNPYDVTSVTSYEHWHVREATDLDFTEFDMLRRENEAEMMFRGQELARAIYRFRKDQNRLPNQLDELIEPGSKGQYF